MRHGRAAKGVAIAALLCIGGGAAAQNFDLDDTAAPARPKPPVIARGDALFAQLTTARDMLAVERWRVRAAGFDRGDHALTLAAVKLRNARVPAWDAREAGRFTHWELASAYRTDLTARDSLTIEARASLGRRRTLVAGYGGRLHGVNALAARVTWTRGDLSLAGGWIAASAHKRSMLARVADLMTETPMLGEGPSLTFEARMPRRGMALTLAGQMLRAGARDLMLAAPPRRTDPRVLATLRADF